MANAPVSTANTVQAILDKIASKDKDFRYMATSDLLTELQAATFKVDVDLEKKLVAALLSQLEDSSGEIGGLAVKCLGLIIKKVHESQSDGLVRSLCDKVLSSKKENHRDIASIALKTIILEIPERGTLATNTATIIASKMFEGSSNKSSSEVACECLDILCELLARFGSIVPTESRSSIQQCTLAYLNDTKVLLRKRAMHCLAAVSVHLTDQTLSLVITELLDQLSSKSGSKQDIIRVYIQTVGLVSRSIGYRFGPHLPLAVPSIIKHLDSAPEGDEELRENCLQAMEGFIQKCPGDCKPHLESLMGASLRFISHDPNFVDDEDRMEDDGDEGGDDDDEEEEEDNEPYSDDEDSSWKVRRGAAKTLTALIHAYHLDLEALTAIYKGTGGPLVGRFKEREENVLVDIFASYVALCQSVTREGARSGGGLEGQINPESPLALLHKDAPVAIKALSKGLKAKSLKTRIGVLGVLRTLVSAAPGCVADQSSLLVPGIVHSLLDKSSGNSALKIEALAFLKQLMTSTPPSTLQPYVKAFAPPVFACASERYYKVSAEALRVCEQMVHILSPPPSPSSSSAPARVPADLKSIILPLYEAVNKRLEAMDQDQEVKEAAIASAAALVSSLAEEIPTQAPQVIKTLLERLRNEVTRLSAVKALSTLCSSPCPCAALSAAGLEAALSELTSFLRKANRTLRHSSLMTLEALVRRYGTEPVFKGPGGSLLVEEGSSLICPEALDMPIASLALQLLVALMAVQKELSSVVVDKAVPPALALLKSPLLQGSALESLKSFFASLSSIGGPSFSSSLLTQLMQSGSARDATKQQQKATAQCLASLSTLDPSSIPTTVAKVLEALGKKPSCEPLLRSLCFLCLGEIGRTMDLSTMSSQVDAAVNSALSSTDEESNVAASLALGGITCGNVPKYLPGLLSLIQASSGTSKKQYLLLQALGDVIHTLSSHSREGALSAGDQEGVMSLLLVSAESGEEECRNISSECLGRLALLNPSLVLGALSKRVTSPSANVRGSVVSAIKFAVVEKAHPIDALLSTSILGFLSLMSDPDKNVRLSAVVALSAVAHHKAPLISPHLPQLLPVLYEQTVVDPEMIRIVDLGPFKHTIDDGLELRKASFECLDILLDSCRSQIEFQAFVGQLESGLQDHYDVKMPAHLLLSKVCALDPSSVLSSLDRIVVPLEKTLTAKTKSDAVQQEIDRHEDMLRSCLRAVDALSSLPGSEACAPFSAFLKKIVLVSPMKEKFAKVKSEKKELREGNGAVGDPMVIS